MAKKNLNAETRMKIIEAYNQGEKLQTLSCLFSVSYQTICRIINKYISTGIINRNSKGGIRNRKLSNEAITYMKELIANNCSISLKEIKNKLISKFNIRVCLSTIHNNLTNFLYTFKRVSLQPETRNSEDLLEKRRLYALNWTNMVSQYDGSNIIFLDETGFNVSLRSKYGRSIKGKMAIQRVRTIRSKNFSVCCAISKNKIIYYKKQDFPFNTDSFLCFIEELKVKLRLEGMTNMIIVMDNVAFHKSSIINTKLTEHGHSIVYLPPYSPFLNPIENMFSKVKQLVRSRRVNDQQELFIAIDESFAAILEADCRGYYRHMLSFIPKCLNKQIIEDENENAT